LLVLCSLVYLVFILFEVIPIIRNKKWKVLVIYMILITVAYTLTVLNDIGVKIPSPSKPIKSLITSVIGKK
jgi:hypothetical protein